MPFKSVFPRLLESKQSEKLCQFNAFPSEVFNSCLGSLTCDFVFIFSFSGVGLFGRVLN